MCRIRFFLWWDKYVGSICYRWSNSMENLYIYTLENSPQKSPHHHYPSLKWKFNILCISLQSKSTVCFTPCGRKTHSEHAHTHTYTPLQPGFTAYDGVFYSSAMFNYLLKRFSVHSGVDYQHTPLFASVRLTLCLSEALPHFSGWFKTCRHSQGLAECYTDMDINMSEMNSSQLHRLTLGIYSVSNGYAVWLELDNRQMSLCGEINRNTSWRDLSLRWCVFCPRNWDLEILTCPSSWV